MICSACPRACRVERNKKHGFCSVGEGFVVARAAKHFWEEPCLSSDCGSGTVFFSGCNLRCVYCQNKEISRSCFGTEVSDERLTEIFDSLIESGACNLNLVTPTHYAVRLARVLERYKSRVPVIYNSSGYESVETLRLLDGLVDIYLPDLKYISAERSLRYSGVSDYFEKASAAINEMKRQQKDDVFEEGLMKKGVVIRHLVLPKNTNQSIKILDHIKSTFGEKTYLSIMSQYTPFGELENFPELQRKITKREYEKVVDHALELGFENVFIQESEAADESFIPPFDFGTE